MSGQDRTRWDQVYREIAAQDYPAPDPILFEFVPPASTTDDPPRRALDLAAGQGQNGLWLASQGYVVDLLDISRPALLRAQAVAGGRGLHNVNIVPVDFDHYTLKPDHYDLLCVFRYLKRDLFIALRQAVRPGGRVIYETFNRGYLDLVPGFNPAFLLDSGELAGYFADWKLLHNHDSSHISRIVAIKPE